MNKFYFFFLLFSVVASSQIVNIPDANLKAKLLSAASFSDVAASGGNWVKIDTNSDGQIQVAEAAIIDSLRIDNSYIYDLTGIQSFTNLKKLNCANNYLTSIDFSGMDLIILDCHINNISSLNLSSMPAMRKLDCSANSMDYLTVSGLLNLEEIQCQDNDLAALDLSGLTSLEMLVYTSNNLTVLDFSGLSSLGRLFGGLNPMPVLDLSGKTNLKVISISDQGLQQGALTTLNAAGCSSLEQLSVAGNAVSNLNITGCNSLIEVDVTGNQLTSLNLTSPMLASLYCANNQLTSLDLSALANLGTLHCGMNDFQVLDVSGHQQLTTINADEGSPESPGAITTLNASGCTALDNIYLRSARSIFRGARR